jgi:nicotinate-nucleotide adenylyltransferase
MPAGSGGRGSQVLVTRGRRIGILGGTFDPIHRGHTDLGRAVEAAVGLTDLVVLPSSVPPHRPAPIASGFHRFAMAALAVHDFVSWRLSDFELARPVPSFTTATLAWLRALGYRPSELYFIVGADAFAEIESWGDYPAILDAAHFAVVSRPGFPVSSLATQLPRVAPRMVARQGGPAAGDDSPSVILIDRTTTDVSSTAIRRRCAARQSIDGLVSPQVAQYIARHGLYAPATSAGSGGDPHDDHSAGALHAQD